MQKKTVAIMVLAAVLAGTYAVKPVWFYRIYNIINPPDMDSQYDKTRIYKTPDKDWYKELIDQYRENFANDWADLDEDNASLKEDIKEMSQNNKYGYLVRDLDYDGVDEFFIGIIDDEKETRFIGMYSWHFDFGVWGGCNWNDAKSGYYTYICEDNIIRDDSLVFVKKHPEYRKYHGEDNLYHIIATEPVPTPQKFELTPLN